GVLPVEGDRVRRVGPVPEAELARVGRDGHLLVEGAVAGRLGPGDVSGQCRVGAGVRVVRRHDRWVVAAVDHPGRQVAGLEAGVLEDVAVARPATVRHLDCRAVTRTGVAGDVD